ncbi:periplasmic heavy metal sensor [Novosphingobium sp. BL-8H]|uniref:periplasmic heavy metal sensor n=1 Tax=Novosphingobium sp. BL-8H TaxID=3127640 RepID=UPI003757F8BA
MRYAYRYVLVALAAFLVALGALWVGQKLRADEPEESRIHVLLHRELDLDAGQKRQIDVLEQGFAARRSQLEGELHAANADLARAIEHEHAYGPDVEKAVDRSHVAMGELQKATLQHVFAMRAVLRPDQTSRFDKAVAEALTKPQD